MANNEISRFMDTKTISFQQKTTLGVWIKPIDFGAIPDNYVATYVVQTGQSGRADDIAYRIYGDSRYDWILYTYNNVVDTINWPPVGLVLKYPIASYVLPRIS